MVLSNYITYKSTTLEENVCYFMYKYNIYNFIWYDSSSSTTSNVICVKTTFHVTSHLGEHVQSILQCRHQRVM